MLNPIERGKTDTDASRPLPARTPRQRSLPPAIKASIGLHAAAPAACLAMPAAWPWIATALIANHAVLGAAGMWPRSTLLGPNFRHLSHAAAARREVALTFDDGPDSAVTPQVLDLLDAAGVQATFFCIGRAARAAPALVRDIARRGHAVQNHSATHPNHFACLPPAGLRREILGAQSLLADITGTAPRYFRAPMGLRSPLLETVLAETPLTLASWTRRALDGLLTNPDRAYRRLTQRLAPGDILLMHDGRAATAPSGRKIVLEILPQLLAELKHRRLQAVRL